MRVQSRMLNDEDDANKTILNVQHIQVILLVCFITPTLPHNHIVILTRMSAYHAGPLVWQ